jgi:dTDP-4-amino-4,6-dideoxygalactose transaminase
LGPGSISERLRIDLSTRIRFLDLSAPHHDLRDELRSVFDTALDTSQFVGGATIQTFDRDFTAFCKSQLFLGVNSGTDTRRFALMAAGVRSGDPVVTDPNTFIAAAEVISQTGVELLPEQQRHVANAVRAHLGSREHRG